MKTILLTILLLSGIAQADKLVCPDNISITKNADGVFVVPLCKWQPDTFYKGKIQWGDGWKDYDGVVPAGYIVVRSQGEGWEYNTTTDINGNFLLPVKAGHDFKLSASHGSGWAYLKELIKGVPAGTTRED